MAKTDKKGPGPAPEVMEELAEGQERLLADESGTVAVTTPGLAPGESSAVIEPPSREELNESLGSLGDAIRQRDGGTEGLDLSEEAHLTAIERMEALGDAVVFTAPALVSGVRDFLLDVIKSRPKSWPQTSPAEQRDVAAACEQLAVGLVRQIVELLRADGQDPVRVLLTKVTMGDDIQITGKVKPLSEDEEDSAVMLLHHARGKNVLLTVASVDDYRQEHREAQTDREQEDLPFERGGHPADDSDLVAAAGPEEDEDDDENVLTVTRVNLQSGWVQVLKEGLDPDDAALGDDAWEDVREATPEELAGERERIADFEQGAAAGEETAAE